jgi:hypothetical protein
MCHLSLRARQVKVVKLRVIILMFSEQNGRPRVQFACAATLAMVTEGQPQICHAIEQADGIRSLVALLSFGGNQGKKVMIPD